MRFPCIRYVSNQFIPIGNSTSRSVLSTGAATVGHGVGRAATDKDADRFEIDPVKLADAWRSPLNW